MIKKSLLAVAVLSLVAFGAGTSHAQAVRDAGAKIRGDKFFPYQAARRTYRAPSATPAPVAAAAAPAERRNFSAEPATPAPAPAPAVKQAPAPAGAANPAPAANAQPRVVRSYSAEPQAAVAAPTVNRASRSQPAWMYPKTDPRRFRLQPF